MPGIRRLNRLTWGLKRVLRSGGTRSGWLGITFLGLSGLFALVTLFLLVYEYGVAGFGPFGDQPDAVQDINHQAGGAAISFTPEPTASSEPIPPDVKLSARAALVLDQETGEVLFERTGDEPLQPASTAKIFTALVVLRHASPDEVIEIVESDVVDPVEESSMGLQAGDRVTVHDLLVGLMLPSGNDAANALARVIGARVDAGENDLPPVDRFVQEMNAVAADLGLSTTKLEHPAGYDREGQAVTARELAVATEALLERPSIGPIISMKEARVRIGGANPRVITVENTNEMLTHNQVFGVKTGTTQGAGECLVVASRTGDHTRITVILGSQDRYGDARTLLNLPDPPDTGTPEPGDGTPKPDR